MTLHVFLLLCWALFVTAVEDPTTSEDPQTSNIESTVRHTQEQDDHSQTPPAIITTVKVPGVRTNDSESENSSAEATVASSTEPEELPVADATEAAPADPQTTSASTLLTTTVSMVHTFFPASSTSFTTVANASMSKANATMDQPCLLVGDLQCEGLELICYGEGTIDCNASNSTTNDTEAVWGTSVAVLVPMEEDDDTTAPLMSASPCQISGNLQCITFPQTDICVGQAKCLPISKMSWEKDRIQDWAIAVIVVLTALGVFLITLVIYLIYNSWRKSKVRPEYVTSQQYRPDERSP